jgi:hypothetical protein
MTSIEPESDEAEGLRCFVENEYGRTVCGASQHIRGASSG